MPGYVFRDDAGEDGDQGQQDENGETNERG